MKFRFRIHLLILFLILVSATLPGITVQHVSADTKETQVFLPVIMVADQTPVSESTPEGKFADLMRNHPDQMRSKMVQNARLTQVAEERALDMATREYFSHTNPDGIGPNTLVEQAGYYLPDWYCQDLDCNNIESIAGGYATPEEAFNNFLVSDGHRRHLLGEISFYAEQTDYGIGFVADPDSQYINYWVIITARH